MDVKQLAKDLKSYPRFINIKGTEAVFRKEAIACIINTFVDKGTEDFNVAFITNESEKEILTLISELPFSSDFKVVFINNAQKYVSKSPKTTILVSLDNSLEKPHFIVDCSRLYGRALRAFVKSKAKSYGLELDKEDIALFVELNGNNLSTLDNEITKLLLLGAKSFKTMRELSALSVTSKLDQLVLAIAHKNTQSALNTYQSLSSLGSTDDALYGFIRFAFKNILESFYEEDSEDLTYDKVKAAKLKPFFDMEFFNASFSYMFNIDRLVKEGLFPFYLFVLCCCKRNFSLIDTFLESLSLKSY